MPKKTTTRTTVHRRHKDVTWVLAPENGELESDQVQIAVLMDIRDELKALNRAVLFLVSKTERDSTTTRRARG